MKCYNCAKGRADTRLWVNHMGRTSEVYLCAGCLGSLGQHIQATGLPFEQQPHDWLGFEQSSYMQEAGDDFFPLDAGDDIKRQRRLCELREKLKDAVGAEDYETAAILRDEIYHIEKEVCV